VAILNPDHLFEQAEKLIAAPPAGPPRQVDLRRAMSAVYYGVFHAVAAAAANEFVGARWRQTKRYALAYRSMDHRWLRELCSELKKLTPARRVAANGPAAGFGAEIQAFATAVIELQEKRHTADYDPLPRLRTSDVRLAISTARSALGNFDRANSSHRKAFLALLMFPPR
jgi:hypothetical protein